MPASPHRPLLVSVHLPKTAGTSFGESLADCFGDRLCRDYDDAPLNTPPLKRKMAAVLGSLRNVAAPPARFECIHGHFLPVKYRWLRLRLPARFVTWMRDPVERLASHYHFWNRSYDPRTARPLHRRVVEEAWPFERFYRSPELLNVYAQFLWGFPVAAFDFIGVTEHYDEDLRFFVESFLGAGPLPTYRVETNAERQSAAYVPDPRVRAEIEAIHHRDMALYRHALRLRQRRTERPVAGG
jgi:hypothetical protein